MAASRSWFPPIIACFLALLACGCSEEASVAPAPAPTGRTALPAPVTPATAPLVLFLGDSLTAGYGLPEDEAFPAIVERRLRERGRVVRVVNAGVSGDTSAGGLRRLPWLLSQEPDVLVVALGGNDGLRGLPLRQTEQNLRAIVQEAQRAGAEVLILGLRLPPNLGPDYVREFEAVYAEVARGSGAALVPFFLEGVGGVAELNQADGIHPTAEGQRRIADNVLPGIEALVPAR